MNLRYQTNFENIEWENIPSLLAKVGMSSMEAEKHKLAFKNSFSVIFVFNHNILIAFGRMISDGISQSAIYDIAVEPDYQGQQIGKEIVNRLMKSSPNCNFILYAAPGKELFYKKLGFKKMKTGMAYFHNSERMNDNIFVESE